MMFFELFVPKGALDPERRNRLAERLLTEFLTGEEKSQTPASVLEASLAVEQVVVHEPETWAVGGRLLGAGEPPRYVVRVTVPGAWRKDLSGEVISRVTRVLAGVDAEDSDGDPRRLYQEPHAWVQVVGVPEGSLGMFGQVMTSSEITDMITKPFRESSDRDALIAALAPGKAIDPICGATFDLAEAEITLEHEGTTYAFCCRGCRRTYLDEIGRSEEAVH